MRFTCYNWCLNEHRDICRKAHALFPSCLSRFSGWKCSLSKVGEVDNEGCRFEETLNRKISWPVLGTIPFYNTKRHSCHENTEARKYARINGRWQDILKVPTTLLAEMFSIVFSGLLNIFVCKDGLQCILTEPKTKLDKCAECLLHYNSSNMSEYVTLPYRRWGLSANF